MRRSKYQFGTLYREARRTGTDVWVYRWREESDEGKRKLRKQVVDTVTKFHSKGEAQQAVEALRISSNRGRDVVGSQPQTFRALIKDYSGERDAN